MSNEPKTEIERAAENKVCDINFRGFIKRAHESLIQYFDQDTEWNVVEDGIVMKKYKCSHSELEYLKDGDEFLFVVDTDSKHITFMASDMDVMMVFGFSNMTPELSVNKDTTDKNLPMLVFLVDLFTKSFKFGEAVERNG